MAQRDTEKPKSQNIETRVGNADSLFWRRPAWVWTFYLLAVFVGAPLLAPWAYRAGQLAGGIPALSALSDVPFHRYLSRCMLIVAIAGLWPLFRAVGLLSWQRLGLAPLKSNLHRLVHGFGLGFLSLAIVLVISLVWQGRAWRGDRDFAEVLRHLLNAGLAAVIVSPLEEILFRGGLFGALRKEHGWKIGLWVSSLVYAAVHFLDRGRWTGPVTWSSGLTLLGQMFSGAGGPTGFVPRFLTLWIAGIVLGVAYHWTGNLWYSIGLHGGWIFWLKSYGFLTSDVQGSALWLWGSNRLIDGWLAVFVMLGVLATVWASKSALNPRCHGNECSRTFQGPKLD